MRINKLVLAVCAAALLASSVYAAEEKKVGVVENLKNKWFSGKKEAAKVAPNKPVAVVTKSEARKPVPAVPQAANAESGTKTVISKDLTKEDLVRYITETLNTRDDVAGLIPELKKEKDPSGKDYYTYTDEGKQSKLEDMDKKSLEKLMQRITSEINRIQSERIQKQIQQIQQQQIQQQQAQQQQQQQQQAQQALRQAQQAQQMSQQRAPTPPPQVTQPPRPAQAPPAPPAGPPRR